MLSVFTLDAHGLHRRQHAVDDPVPDDAVWIDLLEPTQAEELKIEQFLGIDVPTREEMREIESSNRLYEEGGALYMTATIVTKLDTDLPESSQITFILAGNRLITNRYVDPLPFRRYTAYAERHPAQCANGAAVLAGLLESVINRIADVIERVGADLDHISGEVFTRSQAHRAPKPDFRHILERVGQCGELTSKARETMASLGRLLVFVQQAALPALTQDVRSRLRTVSRDVAQMSDHATFLGNKVQFILDATLGMISIDQNNILKIFSVVTVILLPPSVIGAMFGMNFDVIPAAHQTWGFAAALCMMLASSVLPYLIFRRRGWL
jgi:magnesium transporter